MPALTSQDILRVWESGARLRPLERALALLAATCPEALAEELARLAIGDRDRRLLRLREDTFGAQATAAATCAGCGQRIEFALHMAAVRLPGCTAAVGEVEADGWHLRFRPPDSTDLAAALGEPDPRAALAARCVLEARRQGEVVAAPDLPPHVVSRLAAAMAESDPQAEILLDYSCPACGEEGRTLFDIASFLWEEVRAQAQRLLVEVATLARAFGWREADIVSMTAIRRRAYLELVS